MKTKTVAFISLLALPLAWGDLYLNEIRIDQPGADNDEYVEIFGTDPSNDSLADVVLLVIGDGTGGSGVIENVTEFPDVTLGGDPYYVAAESSFTLGTADLTTTLNFENSDNVTFALVRGFTGALYDDLDADDDGTLDVRPWGELLDGVALIESPETPPVNTEWAYTELGPAVGPDGSYAPGHVYRSPDGTGEWKVGEYDLNADDTPGKSNPQSIPEPSTTALLALGLLGAAWRKLRR